MLWENGPFIKCSGMVDWWSSGPLGGAVSADIFIRPSACPLGRVASADSFIRPSACSLGRAASSDPVIRPSACPLGRAASAESCHGPSGLVHVFGDRHQPDPCFRPFTCLQNSSPSVSLLQTQYRLPNLQPLIRLCKNAITRVLYTTMSYMRECIFPIFK